jgi:hypothetical protein
MLHLLGELCGLYYKHIVNDQSSIVIKWSFKIIDATRGVIYDHHMFKVQATDGIYENSLNVISWFFELCLMSFF